MTTTIDDYINRVLAAMPSATPQRAQIVLELRGHIAERIQGGQSEDDVLRQLGDPITLAESYLSAVPLVSASLGGRLVAKTIDGALVLLFVGSFTLLLIQRFPRWWWLPLATMMLMIGGSFAFAFYTIFFEYAAGETVGKRAMKLRVVRDSGTRISLGQAIVRQLPMFLQVSLIDAMFVLFTEHRQRAFELLSKTRVVKASRPETR